MSRRNKARCRICGKTMWFKALQGHVERKHRTIADLARAERIGREADAELRKHPGYVPGPGERKSFQHSSSSEGSES